jgi:hypothetical protein
MGKPFAVVFGSMDWQMLRDQKQRLIELACKRDDELLDGVIHLIDHIQDSASAQGLPVVWLGAEDTDVYAGCLE